MLNELGAYRSAIFLTSTKGNQIVDEPKELFFTVIRKFGAQNDLKSRRCNIDDRGRFKTPRRSKKLGNRNIGKNKERNGMRGPPGRVCYPTITLLIRICAPDLPLHRFGRGAHPWIARATTPRLK
tara:strand:- start:285 stop:659 length:375 start_codon:yes stop_codon:yes gene_type:complete